MKRSRVIVVGLLALGLAGSVTAAAAAGPSEDPSPTAAAGCPPPGQGAGLDKVEVKDGKVYFNGKEVGDAPSPDGPLTVAVKDGKVYVGKDAEKIAPPPGAPVEAHTSTGDPAPTLTKATTGGAQVHLYGSQTKQPADLSGTPESAGYPGTAISVTCTLPAPHPGP
ncbi:hypothetical protein J5X84_30375 [Streptosporangiaceae bacterium NEAU-GS5]|nr:hypothetical protein [Streptosporangiaceae bacterium NEAU-GS5]